MEIPSLRAISIACAIALSGCASPSSGVDGGNGMEGGRGGIPGTGGSSGAPAPDGTGRRGDSYKTNAAGSNSYGVGMSVGLGGWFSKWWSTSPAK
jgi:hypothetical protein